MGGRKQRLGDITDRGLIAYNCGRRLAVEHADEVISAIELDLGIHHLLTDAEQTARRAMMPTTWLASWWNGWHDGLAAVEVAEGAEGE